MKRLSHSIRFGAFALASTFAFIPMMANAQGNCAQSIAWKNAASSKNYAFIKNCSSQFSSNAQVREAANQAGFSLLRSDGFSYPNKNPAQSLGNIGFGSSPAQLKISMPGVASSVWASLPQSAANTAIPQNQNTSNTNTAAAAKDPCVANFKSDPDSCKSKLISAYQSSDTAFYWQLVDACKSAGLTNCQQYAVSKQNGPQNQNGQQVQYFPDGSVSVIGANGRPQSYTAAEWAQMGQQRNMLGNSQGQGTILSAEQTKGMSQADIDDLEMNYNKNGARAQQFKKIQEEQKNIRYTGNVEGKKEKETYVNHHKKGREGEVIDYDLTAAQRYEQQLNQVYAAKKDIKESKKNGGTLTKDGVTQTTAELRTEKRQQASEARQARREMNKTARADAKHAEELSIAQENTTGDYGGRYGGLSRASSQVINAGVEQARTIFEQQNTAAMTRTNNATQLALQSKGMNATNADAIETQSKLAENGAKALGRQVVTTTALGAYQTFRASQHIISKRKVDNSASTATTKYVDALKDEALALRNEASALSATNPQASSLKLKQATEKELYAQEYEQTIAKNQAAEKSAQGQASLEQGVVAAQTLMKAQAANMERKAALETAAMLSAQANQVGSGFTFNPGTPGSNTDDNPSNDPNIPNIFTTSDDLANGIEGGIDPINPMADDGLANAPEAGQFVPNAANGGGGAAGGGVGQAGGTSAAKDEGKGENGGPNKAQTGGSYAAGEGGSGSRFARGGGSGSVGGAENSFLEMMKKFLPEDLGKTADVQKDMNFQDRSIASDQPSVLGRNKNLFEEISKKYKKKNTEGAVVFRDDKV